MNISAKIDQSWTEQKTTLLSIMFLIALVEHKASPPLSEAETENLML